MTYMASCGTTSCDQFDPTDAKWFKIGQTNQDSNDLSYQKAVSCDAYFDLTLPYDLSPGRYRIRHEVNIIYLFTIQHGQALTCVGCRSLVSISMLARTFANQSITLRTHRSRYAGTPRTVNYLPRHALLQLT